MECGVKTQPRQNVNSWEIFCAAHALLRAPRRSFIYLEWNESAGTFQRQPNRSRRTFARDRPLRPEFRLTDTFERKPALRQEKQDSLLIGFLEVRRAAFRSQLQ